jgi:CHAD domain-containing protein
MIEREIKLEADIDMVMPDLGPDLGQDLGPVTVGSPSALQLDAIYYDTSTLSMARSGVTLRARTGEPGPIWTLKLPVEADGEEMARHEFTFDEPLGAVPESIRQAARGFVRSQSIGPVVRLHTHRTEFVLELDGRPHVKVCDDVVSVEGGTDRSRDFREIELEFSSDDVDRGFVERVLERLRAAGCRDTEDALPKAIRALGPRALEPADVEVVPIDKKSTVRDVVRHVIGRSVTQLINHHAGVWLTIDSEELHQFRVGARRLRSDLRSFAPLLDRNWNAYLRDELKWLGTEVAMARDADVLAERLRAQIKRLPSEDARAADRLLQRVADTTAQARSHVIAALSSDRYVALLEMLVDSARDPRFAADNPGLADKRGGEVFARLVRKPWKRLSRAVDALRPDSPPPALHAIRIKSKRARYAAEAVAPLYGKVATRLADALADVQTVLGEYQDTTVAETWLRSAAREVPSTRVVVGELISLERADRARLRKKFSRVWKKASRPKLRKWLS